MPLMASCVAIDWPQNGQCAKCVLDASNPCPHSHVRRLNVKGLIKSRKKCNPKMQIECAMQNKWINGLTINHNPTPLLEQKRMWVLKVKEMESSSKINLKDVSWWMSIKDTYRLVASVIAKLSKERCIPLAEGGRLSWTTQRHDWRRCGPLSTWETYSSKTCLMKIWNLEHKYGTIQTQLLKKIDGAQSSINKWFIPPKEINIRA